MIHIGKILVLTFSDSEEYVLNKILTVVEGETIIEYSKNFPPSNNLTFLGLEIHLKEQAVYRTGELVPLSYQEFITLSHLAQHPGWVFSKEQIYDVVYGNKFEGDLDNMVYCLIHSLRKKLETDPQHPKFIQTVRGVGYKFIGKPENPGM